MPPAPSPRDGVAHASLRTVRAPLRQAIRVFLLSDFELLRQGLASLMANRQRDFVLAGWAQHIDPHAPPWGAHPTDVLLLDMALPAPPEQLLAWVRDLAHRPTQQPAQQPAHEPLPRVMLLAHPQRPELQDHLLLAGARGLLARSCPYEQMLIALAHVHRGDLWLDASTTARPVQRVSQPGSVQGHNPGSTAHAPAHAAPAMQRLSERERDILQALLQHTAAPAKALAQQLHISESTLRNHLTSIYGKLGVRNRSGLLFHAMTQGLGDRLPGR